MRVLVESVIFGARTGWTGTGVFVIADFSEVRDFFRRRGIGAGITSLEDSRPFKTHQSEFA